MEEIKEKEKNIIDEKKSNENIIDSSDDDIYINEGEIAGSKPEISNKQKEELLRKGFDSTCKISLPDVKKGNGFFCQIFYNGKNYNVLILNKKIILKEEIKKLKHLNIGYENKIIILFIQNLDLNYENEKIYLY